MSLDIYRHPPVRRRTLLELMSSLAASLPAKGAIGNPSILQKEVSAVRGPISSSALTPSPAAHITVIGVGVLGALTTTSVMAGLLPGVQCICVDSLRGSSAHVKLCGSRFGYDRARDFSMQPVARTFEIDLHEALKGVKMLFLVADMSRNQDAGDARVIAAVARRMRIETIPVANPDLGRDVQFADAHIAPLDIDRYHLVKTLTNPILRSVCEELESTESFVLTSNVLRAQLGHAGTMNSANHVGVDLEDFVSILEMPFKTLIYSTLVSSPFRAGHTANPSVDLLVKIGVPSSDIKGAIAFFSGSSNSLRLSATKRGINVIRRHIGSDIPIMFSAAPENSLTHEMRISLLVKI